MHQDETLTIYADKRKALGLLLGMPPALAVIVTVTALLALVTLVDDWWGVTMVKTIGVSALSGLIAGVALAVRQYRLLTHRPVLALDAEGIQLLDVDRVRWREIAAVVPYSVGNQHFLGIELTDAQAFLRRQPRLRRWMMRLAPLIGYPLLSIGQAHLPMGIASLLELIHRDYRPKFGSAAKLGSEWSFQPRHIQYALTRRQRLAAHLGVWRRYLVPVVLMAGGALVASAVAPRVIALPWLFVPVIFPLLLGPRFLSGFFNVAVLPSQAVSLTVEENQFRFETKGHGRVVGGVVPFDQIRLLKRFGPDTWTILTVHGGVISIPTDAIDERYIHHMLVEAGLG